MDLEQELKKVIHTATGWIPHSYEVDVEPVPVVMDGLPEAFHTARVAVVADLHLPDSLLPVHRLISCLKAQRPDAVFICGDLTTSYVDFDEDGLRDFAEKVVEIAPCFAIPGNHELRQRREPLYRRILEEAGIHYLYDSGAVWEKDGQSLPVFGMARRRPRPFNTEKTPTVVLAHKPQYFPYYCEAGWKLVVAGHAHGGQFRFGKQGVYSPGQGWFPAYTSGVYRDKDTAMVVSRGLGNSSFLVRYGNKAHLPLLILLKKT